MLKIVTLICTHMLSPVTIVSVPKVIVTALAISGKIGGRPITHIISAIASTVAPISA